MGLGRLEWLYWMYMSRLWETLGICAQAIVAHVACHPATCNVILHMRQLCTLQHDSFVLLGTVAVMNMHADNLSRGAQAVTRPQPSSQQAGNLEVLLPLSHVQDVLFLLRTGERLGLECHVFV